MFFFGKENKLVALWSIIHCIKTSYFKICVPLFPEDRPYIVITKKRKFNTYKLLKDLCFEIMLICFLSFC